ncbi:MAG: helix-turn-helix domain-containing protein [Culicoidibacterales bacterium]
MKVSYNGLWKILIDKELKKKDLVDIGISSRTIAKMSKGQVVSMETISKIAEYLQVDIGDIISVKKEN